MTKNYPIAEKYGQHWGKNGRPRIEGDQKWEGLPSVARNNVTAKEGRGNETASPFAATQVRYFPPQADQPAAENS